VNRSPSWEGHIREAAAGWPLHDIAITNIVWFIAYKGGGRGSVVSCAIDVQ